MSHETRPATPIGVTDRDTRRCPRCSETFPCGARSASCWCDDVALTEAARAELRTLGLDGCLCRPCLEALG